MDFKHFLNALGISTKGIYLFTKKGCERATSKEMQMLSILAEKGLCIFSRGRPTAAFLPALRGHVAKTLEVERTLLEKLSVKGEATLERDDGFYILSYKKVPYFLVEVVRARCRVVGR